MISIDHFHSVEMRMGRILTAERVPDTDKLLKLSVDFGEERPRQVISGIALYVPDLEKLIGRTCPFVTNLEPRTIRGLASEAMIVAVHDAGGAFSLLEASCPIASGTRLN